MSDGVADGHSRPQQLSRVDGQRGQTKYDPYPAALPLRESPDGGTRPRGEGAGMSFWLLTILICSVLWVLGTIALATGATWLMRHDLD